MLSQPVMKNVWMIVGFFCAVGLGWGLHSFSEANVEEVAKVEPDTDGQKGAKLDVENSDQSATPVRTKTVIIEASEEDDEESAEEEAEEIKEHVDRMVASFKNKVKLRMDLFLPKLNLSDSQLAVLEKFMEEQSSLYNV